MRFFLAALSLACVISCSTPAKATEPQHDLRFPAGHMLDVRPFAKKVADYPRKRADRHVSRHVRSGKSARPAEKRTAALDHLAPAPLNAKVQEIITDCGSHIASGFRPGARVRGSGSLSNHALHRAYDLKGNPACIYGKLHGWPGGYSTDYHSAPGGSHVHISYNPSKEWGLRFVHNGGRFARRHRGRVS